MRVDLNADLGESFGSYKCGMDEEVIQYISSANVACGFHASDPLVMDKTVRLAKVRGVRVGAHPGFPDLVGFGRRYLKVSPDELKSMVQYQVGALSAICTAHGMQLSHVKPHGAMYNMAAKDKELALAIAQGIREVNPNLILLGLSGSCLMEAAEEAGIPAASEVFADRAYNSDGTLVERGREGAVITDETEAISRVVEMVRTGTITSIDGERILVKADSVCLHGDGIKAVEFAKRIRETLRKERIEIMPIEDVIGEKREAC